MYRHILLAYDGSTEGAAALSQGAELARALGAHVTLLAVVAPSGGIAIADAVGPGDLLEREQEAYRAVLRAGLDDLAARGLTAAGRLAHGLPTEEIAATARAIRADLIVVGHRRMGALARWWSGSVGASLLDAAPCSVLVAVEG